MAAEGGLEVAAEGGLEVAAEGRLEGRAKEGREPLSGPRAPPAAAVVPILTPLSPSLPLALPPFQGPCVSPQHSPVLPWAPWTYSPPYRLSGPTSPASLLGTLTQPLPGQSASHRASTPQTDKPLQQPGTPPPAKFFHGATHSRISPGASPKT